MTEFSPPETLLAITKIKYQRAVLPLLLIIVIILGDGYVGLGYLRYLSLFGLAWFLLIQASYRVNKSILETSEDEIVSPISGIVNSVDREADVTSLVVKKPLHFPADIRYAADNQTIDSTPIIDSAKSANRLKELKLSGEESLTLSIAGKNVLFFPQARKKKGVLAGIVSGSGLCKVSLPNSFSSTVKVGDRLEAGSSVIGFS